MRIIAVAMAKGGVGKTTTAVNLAHGLAQRGQRVLLVDGDTQGQSARFLGVKPAYGLREFITGSDAAGSALSRNAIICQARPNLWLLAGGFGLVELKTWLGEQPAQQREVVLRRTLRPQTDYLDYLIFDCAPGWDVLSVNILMAADDILCPVVLQAPAMEGLKTFFGYLLSLRRNNPRLELRYVLPTMYVGRTRQSAILMGQLERLFRRQLCSPIRANVRLSEAPGLGRTIFEYDARASGAEDYRRLVQRVMQDRPREAAAS